MRALLILAIAGGIFFGVFFAGGMTLAGYSIGVGYGLLSGILFGAAMFGWMLLLYRKQEKRLRAAANKLPEAPEFRLYVNLIEAGRPYERMVFLCKNCLCLVDTGNKEMPLEVYSSRDIVRAALPTHDSLEIHLTEGRTVNLSAAASAMLLDEMKKRGWLPFQHE